MASKDNCKERQNEPQSDSTPVISNPSELATDGQDSELVAGNTNYIQVRRSGTNNAAVQEETPNQESSAGHDRRIPVATIEPAPPQPPVSTKSQQPDFHGNRSSESPTKSQSQIQPYPYYDLPNLLKANPGKTGLAFLSACTGTPGTPNYIENCTAVEKMRYCLETQLGYLTVVVGENVTKSHILYLFDQVKTAILPNTYSRVIFYHFGHGDDGTILVADEILISRSDIISCFQSIRSENLNVFKIFIFDCCRLVSSYTMESVDVHKPWIPAGPYPQSTNTLVVNSTACNLKAYYDVKTGCGLMTQCFVKFAPKNNESLRELLVTVRSAVVEIIEQEHLTQLLVYEDKLMGKCNLLAESQGIARVFPTSVHASPSVLSTNIHLTFDATVEPRVAEFIVEVSSDDFYQDIISNPIPPNEQMATFSGLVPNTEYTARVAAVYKDRVRVGSGLCTFTTPRRTSPSDIVVMQLYPGSPCAHVTWKYSAALSDLDRFEVAMKTDEELLAPQKVTNDRLGTTVKGLLPLKKHVITVIAVYRDGQERENSVEYYHTDLPSPEELKFIPEYSSGSPKATLTWSFPHPKKDLSYFRVTAEVEGKGRVFDETVTTEENKHQLRNLRPSEKHKLSVVAVYKEGDERCCNIEVHHTDRSSPTKLEVMQEISGSNEARVKWEFPDNCTPLLSDFFVRVITEDNQEIVEEMKVASSARQYKTFILQPSTKYRVTVTARYNDGLEREAMKEHLNCELQAADLQNVTLTKLRNRDSKSVYRIDWSYENDNPLLNVKSFEVLATQIDPERSELPVLFAVTNPNLRSTEIELAGGDTYSICVETHFVSLGLQPQKSKDIKITTPPDNDVKPMIDVPEENVQLKSATAIISEPLILQKGESYVCEGLRLVGIKYLVKELPQHDGGDSREEETLNFKEPYSPNSNTRSHNQPQSKAIPDLKAGTNHVIRLRAEYSTGDCIESDPIRFCTQPYNGIQKCRCCSIYICLFTFLALVLLSSLFLCGSFGAYRIVLHRSTTCSTDYVLTADGVDCGEANSLYYGAIQLSGNQQKGDTLLGVIQAWLVKKADLVFYSTLQPPVLDSRNSSEHQQILLRGWQIYTWTGSVIYGYCCIVNYGISDATAKLYMFTSDKDAVNFANGQGAENSILYDSIQIPPHKQQCFHSWGAERPFKVSQSAYHFIGVDIPGNTTFSSNITVLRKYVNGSDYGTIHFFQYDNSTDFSLPGELFSRDEYVTICKAPLYLSTTTPAIVSTTLSPRLMKDESLASRVGSESLHLTSCNEPHHWMDKAFPWTLVAGLVVFVFSIISFSVVCFRMCKYDKDRLFLSCVFSYRHNGYDSIQ